jgi:nitrite transporter NirC
MGGTDGEHAADITFAGAIHNEIFVTLGNLVGGAIFMSHWLQESRNGHPSTASMAASATGPPH